MMKFKFQEYKLTILIVILDCFLQTQYFKTLIFFHNSFADSVYHFRTTHEFLFGALAELVDNARYVVFCRHEYVLENIWAIVTFAL